MTSTRGETGRTRSRWRGRLWRLGICVVVVAAILLPIRAAVAQTYHAASDAASPEIPQGSYILVFKLAKTYQPGDIIVYRQDDKAMLARVVALGEEPDAITVQRRDAAAFRIPRPSIVGRAVLNTR